MKIRDLSWRRYAMPFVAPFRTAHGVRTVREGLIVRLTSDDGLVGLGEAAPLPEFGHAGIDEIERTLRSLAPALLDRDPDQIERLIEPRLAGQPRLAALRCALDTAPLDLEARSRDVRMADLLVANPAASVRVNATIGAGEIAVVVAQAQEAVSAGFGTVKLKVGVCSSIEEEVRRVAAVREVIEPSVALRLDANGAWEPDCAIATLTAVREFDIELVEQPTADLDGMAAVRRAVDIPLAADELVTGLESARRVIDAGAADGLVIKPMVCGGLRAARHIVELAESAGLKTIVTSALESGIGVAAALQLAATLPSEALACGLATLGLLSDDLLVDSLDIVNGAMRLPGGPGLGITLAADRLDQFSVGGWRHPRYSSISQTSETRS